MRNLKEYNLAQLKLWQRSRRRESLVEWVEKYSAYFSYLYEKNHGNLKIVIEKMESYENK